MELFKLLGTIAVDNAEAKKALQDTSREGEKTESKLGKVFGGIGKAAAVAGKAIATGLAAGAAAMAGLTVKALQASGDLEQNMGGAEAVFGELGKTIGDMEVPMQKYDAATGKVITETANLEKVSKEAYKNMGLSQSDYLATANKMGALFKGAGFETQEALNMSSEAMQRAADVASIMGIDTESAMEAVAGAAKGNFTMMDNLGVAMNDTAIAAYAASQGINKSTSEMTQQEKIGLAMEMFLEKTSYAAGNYAKENETLAGSLSTAKSALTNFLAGSGDVESVVSSISNVVNVVMNSLTDIVPRLTTGLTDIVNQIAPMLPDILNQLLPVLIEGAVSLVQGLVAAIPGIISALTNALPALIQGIVNIVNALVAALPQIIQALVDALPTLIPALVNGIVSMIVAICQNFSAIIQPLIDALPTIIVTIIEAILSNLPALIQGIIQLIMGIVQAIPQIIQALVDALPTIISMIIEALLTNLPAIISGLIQVVFGIVTALPQILGSLIKAIPEALSGIWDGIKNVFGGLGDWFGEKFKGAKEAATKAWEGAKETWSNIKDKVSEGFSNLKDKVGEHFRKSKENAEKAWEKAKETWNKVKDKVSDAFSNLKDKVKNHFKKSKENAEKAWDKAKETWNKVKDKVSDAFSNLKDKLKEKFTKAKENSEAAWSKAKDAWSKISDKVSDGFSGLGGKLKEKFKGALDTAKKGFSKALSIGKDLVKGIWNGISGAYDWIKKKIKSWVGNVTKFIKKLFGIKSPSTVMRDQVGKFLAEGVAVGIDENTSEVEKASEEMAKKVLDAAQKRLDDYKIYNNLALSEEVAYWDKVRQQIEEGTDARISADQKYLEAKKSLDDQILTAEEGLQSELDEIAQRITERQQSIMDSFALFDGFDSTALEEDRGYNNQDALLLNLAAQIDSMEEYVELMDGLEARIGGTALFEELENMGIDASGNIAEIAKMTDEQLQAYAKRYDEKVALAKRMAEEELAPQMMEDSQKAFDNFVSSCGDLGVEITSTLADYMATAEGAVMKSLAAISSAFSTFQLGALNMDAVISAPTLSDATVYTLNASAVGNTATEGTKASGTMSDVFASIVEQKNMMQKLIEMLAKFFPELIEAFDVDIFINGRVLAAELAPDMDAALGRISGNRERGR